MATRRKEDPSQEQAPHTLAECRRCDLWKGATQPVGGLGPRRARIFVLGEQPGNEEDLRGQPFVGPAGRILEAAFQAAGVERASVYLTNAVKHFKYELRGKRRMHKTPAQREVDACQYWLERELNRVAPRVIVTLGATALRAVRPDLRLAAVLGTVIELDGERVLVPTYHPSFVLRQRDQAAREETLAKIVAALEEAKRIVERDEES